MGTQLWVGYGCEARSFDHHPITKPEKTLILQPMFKPFVSSRALFKTNLYFLPCKLGCICTFWQPIGKLKEKIHRKLSILQKRYLYLNQFSNKKGPLVNLRDRKGTLSGPHIPVPTFPLSTPPGVDYVSLSNIIWVWWRCVLRYQYCPWRITTFCYFSNMLGARIQKQDWISSF